MSGFFLQKIGSWCDENGRFHHKSGASAWRVCYPLPMNQQAVSAKTLLIGFIAFLWIGLLAGAYFWGHPPFNIAAIGANPAITQPFNADSVRTIGQHLLNLGGWLGLWWLAAGLGRLAFGRVMAGETAVSRITLSIGIGLGLISLIMGVLGLMGLFNRPVAWLLVAVLSAITCKQWRSNWHDVRTIRLPRAENNSHRLILVYGFLSLAMTFLIALAPIIAWDALTYHLVAPRFFIAAGKFVHPVNIQQMGFPLLGQMQFTLGMLLVGDGVAPLLHYGYGLLTVAITAALTRRAFGKTAVFPAVMVLLTIPSFYTLMRWPYVDITLMFYTTAAFYAFHRWMETKTSAWLIILGLFIGFSGGLKYTAVATPIAIAIALIWVSRRDGALVIFKRLFLIGAVALVTIIPWLIENAITTGNPIYPFFFDNARFWDDWWTWWYSLPGTGLATTAPVRLPFIWLEATILGRQGSSAYDATIGPFIFGLLVLLPLVWGRLEPKEKRVLWFMLLLIGINYLLWLNGIAQTALLLQARLIFLIFGITAVIGGLILSKLQTMRHPQLNAPWLIQTLVNITLVVMLVSYGIEFLAINPVPAVIGLESEADYLERRLGVYQTAVVEGINRLPAGSAVVMLWEPRTYGCDPAIVCDPDPILGRFLHLTQHDGLDAAGIAQKWQADGFTHLFLFQGGLDFLLEAADNPIGTSITAADLAILEDLQQNHLTAIEEWGDQYTLYKLK